MKPAQIIAVCVIVVGLVATLFALSGAMAPHVSIDQAKAKSGEVVQVPGMIVKESVAYDARAGTLRFDVIGMDRDSKKPIPGQRMTVLYSQPKPENFDTAETVEAVGQYKNGVFVANNLLVKCPSKYGDEQKKVAGK